MKICPDRRSRPRSPARRRGQKEEYPSPSAINVVRFTRSLFEGRARERERSLVLIEATLTTIEDVSNAEHRRPLLSDLMNRTYESLAQL